MSDTTTLSHKQLVRMAELTQGYRKQNFEFWVSAQHIVYLTVYNVVYNIDVDGGYVARAKATGNNIDKKGPVVFEARILP